MKLTEYIIGFIIFSLFITIMLSMAYNMYNSNNLNISMDNNTDEIFSDFETSSQSVYEDMTSFSTDIANKSPGGAGVGLSDLEGNSQGLFTGWHVLSSIPDSYSAVKSTASVTTKHFGQYIDPRFVYALVTLIVISITLLILSSFLSNRIN